MSEPVQSLISLDSLNTRFLPPKSRSEAEQFRPIRNNARPCENYIVGSLITITGITLVVTQKIYSSNDPRIKSLVDLTLGGTIHSSAILMLPKNILKIDQFFLRLLALEIFLSLWQGLLNDSSESEELISSALDILSGVILADKTDSFFNARLNSKKNGRRYGTEKKIETCCCKPRSRYGRGCLKAIKGVGETLAGAALMVASSYVGGAKKIILNIGGFFCLRSVSRKAYQVFDDYRSEKEKEFRKQFRSNHYTPIPCSLKVMRLFSRAAFLFGDMFWAFLFAHHGLANWMIAGMISAILDSAEFNQFLKISRIAQGEQLPSKIKKCVHLANGTLLLALHAYILYGITSLIIKPQKGSNVSADLTALISFLFVFHITLRAGKTLNSKFNPPISHSVMNWLQYHLIENPQLLTIPHLIITGVEKSTDESAFNQSSTLGKWIAVSDFPLLAGILGFKHAVPYNLNLEKFHLLLDVLVGRRIYLTFYPD